MEKAKSRYRGCVEVTDKKVILNFAQYPVAGKLLTVNPDSKEAMLSN